MVFLFILAIIILIITIICFSKIRIEILKFNFNSQTKRHINENYNFIIKLYILKFIPILKLEINKRRLDKIKLKEKLGKIDIKKLQDNRYLNKNILPAIKKINVNIKKINLYISIGTENACLTSIIVPTISTIIVILLHRKIKNYEEQKFIIEPVYMNQNLVNIDVSGIFEIKISHIINMISNLSKKEKKGVKEYERTSNRRAYGYSYE